jgi:hypothetical protein
MRHLLIILCVACLANGCALKKKKPSAKPPGPVGPATLLGMVEMVNPEQNYVLIRCDQMPALADGTQLTTLGADGSKATLLLTPERKGRYLTADIKEGQPAVNHLVLLPKSSLPPPPAVTEPSAPVQPPTHPGRTQLPILPDIPLNIPNSLPPAPSNSSPTSPARDLSDLEPPVR